MSFSQSDWLATYVEYNMLKRRESTSGYAKDFFKLMNNSVYRKTQENIRNRVNVKMMHEKSTALKPVAKDTFKSLYAVREDLCVITSRVATLKLCTSPLSSGLQF